MVDNEFGQVRLVDMNLWGNILMFVPAGIYIALHSKSKSIIKHLLIIFLFTFVIEVVQYIFTIGATDIDDIILNVLGECIGLMIYKVFEKIFKTEEKIKTAVSILSLIVGLPIFALVLLLIVAN